MQDMEASTVANIFYNFVCRFGAPVYLHTDQGCNFESKLIYKVCALLGIEKTRTSSYHPQSNGMVEQFNKTLLDILSSTAANEDDWDLVLPSIMLAYWTSVHSTTKHTPFQLMFGREAKLPVDVIFEAPTPSPLCTSQYVLKLKTDLLQSYHLVRKFSGCETRYQKQLYDRNIKYQEYQKNDLVWLLCPAVPRGRHRKFHHPWDGPYVIKKKLSDAVY